jgi:hypothetical protein
VGVTAHAAFVPVVGTVFVVVAVDVGLEGESLQPRATAALAAPIKPIASRLPIFFPLMPAPC